jgi:hypothetical protein
MKLKAELLCIVNSDPVTGRLLPIILHRLD